MKRTESKYSVAIPSHYGEGYKVNHKQMPDGPADIAFQFILQWGRTSLMPDPANPQERDAVSWVLMPPEELITRAFDVADRFYQECENRGLLLELDYTEEPNP